MTVKYPIGIQDFAKLREGDFIYVDKTEQIYNLLHEGAYIFLSRPRRFGKSLLMSTIKYLFLGERQLFKGLWIDSSDYDWTPKPVFHFDFANLDTTVISSLEISINAHLSRWEHEYVIDAAGLDFSQRFYNLLKYASNQTSQRCVVLIDEYDKMLANNLHRPQLHDEARNILRPLYSNLKAADQYIHFAMLTGVSRFSKLSIFSDLNNLMDISLYDSFATICGITEDEMLSSFTEGIQSLAERYEMDYQQMVNKLKATYDGYHFTANCPDLYNPYSLITAFQGQSIGHFWFETGTPTFIVDHLKRTSEDVHELLSPIADGMTLASGSSADSSIIGMMFQTGYLTIKSYERDIDIYQLGVPNAEVESALFKFLLPLYTGRDSSMNQSTLYKMRMALLNGQSDRFVELLQGLMAGVAYDVSEKKKEIYFENNLYLILRLLGLFVNTEFKTSAGRCDVVIYAPKYIYVIELKLGHSAAEAMEQINSRQYALPFTTDSRQVIKIGINISPDTRTIDEWLVEA